MSERNARAPSREGPSASALFACFARISLLSVGGGLSAWIRRSVVEQRGWMDERQFLSGFALSQVAPGPSAVNLAVFVGATLGGRRGAAASLVGLIALPFVLILVLGATVGAHELPGAAGRALTGLGAGAIGLMIATGVRMGRAGITGIAEFAVALATTIALASGASLLPVVALALLVSLLVVRIRR